MTGEDENEEYDIVGRTEATPERQDQRRKPRGPRSAGQGCGRQAEVLLPTGHTVEYTVLNITHAAG